jgi:hypothetical protein
MIIEGHGSLWSVLGGLALLGAVVAAFEALVRRALLRRWAAPLAVLGLSISFFTLLLADRETGWDAAVIPASGIGVVISAAFCAWWFTSAAISRLPYPRGRRSPRAGEQ